LTNKESGQAKKADKQRKTDIASDSKKVASSNERDWREFPMRLTL
jgi:hypothetical protein